MSVSKEDEIRERLAAAIDGRMSRDRVAQAAKLTQAESDDWDFEQFTALVEREIVSAFNSFKSMLTTHGIDVRVERPESGTDSRRRDVVKVRVFSKLFDGNSVNFSLAFSRAHEQPGFVTMYDPDEASTSGYFGRGDVFKYEDVSQDLVLERLTTLFEQAMKRPG